jgi:hypothetical protein
MRRSSDRTFPTRPPARTVARMKTMPRPLRPKTVIALAAGLLLGLAVAAFAEIMAGGPAGG